MSKRKGIKPPDKDVLLDIRILKKFTHKIKHCEEKNRRFNLTFQSFKNMFKAKKCYFTGMHEQIDTYFEENYPDVIRRDALNFNMNSV